MAKRGRPFKLAAEHRLELAAIAEASPTAMLEKVGGEELQRRTGIEVREQTLLAVLHERYL